MGVQQKKEMVEEQGLKKEGEKYNPEHSWWDWLLTAETKTVITDKSGHNAFLWAFRAGRPVMVVLRGQALCWEAGR